MERATAPEGAPHALPRASPSGVQATIDPVSHPPDPLVHRAIDWGGEHLPLRRDIALAQRRCPPAGRPEHLVERREGRRRP